MPAFDGIDEKLKRADENIINLAAEIDSFFQAGKYPVIPHPDDKSWQEAVDYHRSRKIPKRFSVLAGEIVHHLRSCLDHIVWQFSSEAARRDHENALEFPIYRKLPGEKELPGYERKIQGITNSRVRELIEKFQPYHRGADAANHPLCIVHDMDRFDKHRELAIVFPSALVIVPGHLPDVARKIMLYQQGKLPKAEHSAARRALKQYCKVAPNVSFRQFGKGENQPVVPALKKLLHDVRDVVELFAKFK